MRSLLRRPIRSAPATPADHDDSFVILIFSTANDPSTPEVMRWLEHLGERHVLRINDDDPQHRDVALTLGDDTLTLRYGDVTVALDDVRAVWYRKGSFWFDRLYTTVELPEHPALAAELNRRLANESAKAREYFHYLLAARTRTLGNARIAQLNKIVVLAQARDAGFATPRSIVSNRRDAFVDALADGGLVTKAMSNGVYLWDHDDRATAYFSYTERLDADQLGAAPDAVPLAFAQHEIAKDFEVRTFYLDGECWSTAILSQSDPTTSVDYRKYNAQVPNRNVPYRLPADVEARLRRLFDALALNTGSVDFIVDRDGRHVFLEVNPAGQYAGIARDCNYDLDRRIAQWLMATHEQRRHAA